MRTRATLVALALALALTACDADTAPAPPGSGSDAVAASGSSRASAAPSATKSERCLKLNLAIGEAARAAPRACKKGDSCELAGPSACQLEGEAHSCMVAVAKGYAKGVNAAADAWRSAGCEEGLKELPNETPVCKAGTCFVKR